MVTKGEIDRFEQFILLSPCFQKAVRVASESVYMRERVKSLIYAIFLSDTFQIACVSGINVLDLHYFLRHQLQRRAGKQTIMMLSSPEQRKLL